MTRTVRVSRTYHAAPDRVWQDLLSYRALADAMAGRMLYPGLPEGLARAGDAFTVRPRLWGVLPLSAWHIEVVAVDHAARRMRSFERGGVVRRWDHTLTVEPHGAGARYEDEVVIDAGLLTPLVARWARRMYEARGRARESRVAGPASGA